MYKRECLVIILLCIIIIEILIIAYILYLWENISSYIFLAGGILILPVFFNIWEVKSKYLHYIVSTFVYIIITLVFLYPHLSFNGHSFYGDGIDPYGSIWGLWWFKKSLTELFTNPLYTDYIFLPVGGVSLIPHSTMIFDSLLSIPLQYIFDLYTSWNILVLLSFVLSGLGGYCLIYYLTKKTLPSFVGGFLYAFSPFHIFWSPTIGLGAIQFMPFYICFFIKALNNENKINIFLAALFLFFILISSWYYFYYSLIFTIFYLIYIILSNKDMKKTIMFFKDFIIFVIIFVIISSPIIYLTLNFLMNPENKNFTFDLFFEKSIYIKGAIDRSVNLISFFIPPPLNNFLGDFSRNFYVANNIYSSDKPFWFYIGYSVIFLIIVSLFNLKKNIFWVLFLLFSFFVTSGPQIKILNFVVADLTYIWKFMPFMSLLKEPFLFDAMLVLASSVLVGYGLEYILENYKKEISKVLLLLVIVLIFLEYSSSNIGSIDVYEPIFFKNLAKSNENITLLEVPSTIPNKPQTQTFEKSMFYQTIHGKKLILGHIARPPPNVLRFIDNYEIVKYFIGGEELRLEKIDIYKAELLKFVNEYNLKYIVFEKGVGGVNKDFMTIFTKMVISKIEEIKVYEDDEIVVYDISNLFKNQTILIH